MNDKAKEFVAQLLNEGVSLSDIQKKLSSELNINITFLELRLLASELENINWGKQKSDVEAAEAAKKKEEEESKETEEVPTVAKTTVELSKIATPGAIASGTVNFKSGATASWTLDQTGRLGLDKNSGEPNEEDIEEFKQELQSILAKGM